MEQKLRTTEWENKEIIAKGIERFRFFDDLHPAVRKAVRECNYQINVVEIMSKQHEYYANQKPLEELAADIRRRDKHVFEQRTLAKLRSA